MSLSSLSSNILYPQVWAEAQRRGTGTNKVYLAFGGAWNEPLKCHCILTQLIGFGPKGRLHLNLTQ